MLPTQLRPQDSIVKQGKDKPSFLEVRPKQPKPVEKDDNLLESSFFENQYKKVKEDRVRHEREQELLRLREEKGRARELL